MLRGEEVAYLIGEDQLYYETAADLGLLRATGLRRPISAYIQYQQIIKKRKERASVLRRIGRAGTRAAYLYCQHCNSVRRNKFWRSIGYPNLVRAWAARRANCEKRRQEKAEAEERERMRKMLAPYLESTLRSV